MKDARRTLKGVWLHLFIKAVGTSRFLSGVDGSSEVHAPSILYKSLEPHGIHRHPNAKQIPAGTSDYLGLIK